MLGPLIIETARNGTFGGEWSTHVEARSAEAAYHPAISTPKPTAVARSRVDLLHSARAIVPALLLVVVWRIAWPALLDAGAGLRARHRWAVCEVSADVMRLMLWAPVPPLAAESPLAGSPEGVRVRTNGDDRPTAFRLRLGGGPLVAGQYTVTFIVQSTGGARITLADTRLELQPGGYDDVLEAVVSHPGGPLTLSATTAGPAGSSIWFGQANVAKEGRGAPTAAPLDGQQATGKTLKD